MVEHTCIIISIFIYNIYMKITLISVYENFKIGHTFAVMAACQHCSLLSNFLIHKASQEIDYLPH